MYPLLQLDCSLFNMTANPSIFQDDRCINYLPIVTVHDAPSDTYTAWYVDMPYLVVQAKNKEQVRERLIDAFKITLKYYKR